MIKKSVFENDLIAGMERELVKNANSEAIDNLDQAVESINSAIQTFDDLGMHTQANQLLNLLLKIAKKHKKVSDPSTRNLTSEQMIKNLINHGTEFNMVDDSGMDDLLEADIGTSNEVSEFDIPEMDFEDEL